MINSSTPNDSSAIFDISFDSQLIDVEAVVNKVIEFVDAKKIDVNHFGLRLVLFEALTNAAKHGNLFNKALRVSISIKVVGNELYIIISDEGHGFDWKSCLNKTEQPEDMPGGRGLLIFKAYGYHPSYNEKGNVLTLCKNLLDQEE